MSKMKLIMRAIPSSGELLPAVGLGTWQAFDVDTESASTQALKQVMSSFTEKFGTVVDTSPMYGMSEQVIGALSTQLRVNKNLFLATKVWTSGEAQGIAQMRKSMTFLKRDGIDLMQIHNLVDWKTHIKTLRKWKDEGTIRYLGVTHYTESAYATIEKIMEAEALDFIQINYSLASREAERRLLPLAKDKGVGVLINRPFHEGGLHRFFTGKDLPAWSAEINCTNWTQLFLKFIVANPAVTCVIPATSNPNHMIDNMVAAYGPLPTAAHCRELIKLMNS